MQDIDSIWTRYGAALRRFLQNRVADPDDVEDLLQEVLIRTHAALPRLRDPDRVGPWLFRVARNASIDFYRSRGRDAAIRAEDLWYEAEEADVLADFETCVLPFLSALPADEAELLRAIDIEGMAQKTYAERQGISYSTLKSRVQAARKNLRRLFDQCCSVTLDSQGNVMEYQRRQDRCGGC